MSFDVEQIGSANVYRIVRTINGVQRWLKRRDSDSTIIWGDPRVVSDETVVPFDHDTAYTVTGALAIANQV